MLQNFAKFPKIQLDNLVDFEKCCKTRIFLQRSVPIEPKTSEILPNFCENWQLPYGSEHAVPNGAREARAPRGGRGLCLEPCTSTQTPWLGLLPRYHTHDQLYTRSHRVSLFSKLSP